MDLNRVLLRIVWVVPEIGYGSEWVFVNSYNSGFDLWLVDLDFCCGKSCGKVRIW